MSIEVQSSDHTKIYVIILRLEQKKSVAKVKGICDMFKCAGVFKTINRGQ